MKGALVRLTAIATVLLMLCIMEGRGGRAFADASDPVAGTQIVNAASATFGDSRGNDYNILSNQVLVTVQAVSALTVTPKEQTANPATDGYPVGQNVTRTFLITNASNIADAYRITSFAADKGSVVSLAFVTPGGLVPVTVGSTVSPTIQPGQNIAVQAVLSTAGIAVGAQFALHLTAQTTAANTANGLQSDTGEQWLVAATGPSFTGPGGGNAPITKTVNHVEVVQTQGGSVVQFDIVVMNAGGTPATNAQMTDQIPAGLTPDLSSVKINGVSASNATFSNQILTVPLGTFDAGTTDDISFNSTIVNAATLGTTFVNVAAIGADGIPPISTTPAAILIGTADIVFDPANNNAPVAGAVVSLLDANGKLVPLSASSSSAASGARARFAALTASSNTSNPYVTGSDGVYGFALQPSQISPNSTFYITISATGYLNRRIKMDVTPSSITGLYDVVSTSADNQPIAAAGAYALTTSSVSLNNIFGLFGNLPLFKAQVITINKTADRNAAQPGDRVVYTIDVANPSGASLQNAQIVDVLPAGEAYATGSGRLNGKPLEPSVSGRTLTWTLPLLASGSKYEVTYAVVVYPNVAPGTVMTNTASAIAVISGTHVSVNAAANAEVVVTEGALSDRSVITGRVFADAKRTGRFVKGDQGIAGVRVFMEDGTSAVTDPQGRFSFPAVRPGMHVLRVDKTTLPDGMHGGTLQRLVHGVLDDGLMQDIEFAVGPGT